MCGRELFVYGSLCEAGYCLGHCVKLGAVWVIV